MGKEGQHTHKRHPRKLKAHNGQDGKQHPQGGLGVERNPEEAAVGRVDHLGARLGALKDPLGVARGRVDLVPPAEADEAPPGNVLEVVEVGGEEEDGDDEDHDAARRGRSACLVLGTLPWFEDTPGPGCGWVSFFGQGEGGKTYVLVVNHSPPRK